MPKDQVGLVALLLRFLPLNHAPAFKQSREMLLIRLTLMLCKVLGRREGPNCHPEQPLRCAIPSQGPGDRDSLQGHVWGPSSYRGTRTSCPHARVDGINQYDF